MNPPRARLLATPSGVRLGPVEIVRDGGARNFVLEIGEARFHGFVLRRGQEVRGYADRCPHAGLPLAQILDAYLSPDGALITCSWHGAMFDWSTGTCVGGPCVGERLTAWPVRIEAGQIVTG